MLMQMGQLYTIGCSKLTLDEFLVNLKKNHIDVVADVRSVPYSRITPQFNRDSLKLSLRNEKVLYGDFSKEFGARRIESAAYYKNQVSFDKTKELISFSNGIKRIEKGLSMGYSIALMCTEKDPLQCHRFSLVSRGIFEKLGISCSHIMTDGSIRTTESLEEEMLKALGIEEDLFLDYNMRLKIGYEYLNKKIGYVLPISLTASEKVEENENSYEEDIYMFG